MIGCFQNVPTQNVNMFLLNMILYDTSFPHSSTRLSPISFQEFLVRNQIVTVRPLDIYNEANNIWRQYIRDKNIDLNETRCRTMDQVAVKQGGWNIFIDFLMRLIKVEKINNPFYQMHYLAHLGHEYTHGLDKSPIEADMLTRAMTLFTAIMSPVLYDVYIPTTFVWMPIKNYLDIRFDMGVKQAVVNARDFIRCHCAAIDHNTLDKLYVKKFMEEVETLLKAVVKVKYSGASGWNSAVDEFLKVINIQLMDLMLCELFDVYRRDKLKCCVFVDSITNFRNKYTEGKYNNNADKLIDTLLDIRSDLKK